MAPKVAKAMKATPKAAPKAIKAMEATPKASTQEHPCVVPCFLGLAGYDLLLATSVQPLHCKK